MKQILIFLMIFNCCLVYGQQLLTPYNGTLSAAAQQTLQDYQADTSLTYIGTYKVNGREFYENTLNVNFGSQSFQFFLDRRSEVATKKIWQGISIFGDGIKSIYSGSLANITISTQTSLIYKIYRLENNIHACFEKNIVTIDEDCDVTSDDEEEMTSHDKNNKSHLETHCPVRVGMAITQSLLSSTGRVDIEGIIEARIDESNEVYFNSRSNGIFEGIEVELAFIQMIPNYSEFTNSSNTETKSTRQLLRNFRKFDGELEEIHPTRDYYDADFCGLILDDKGLIRDEWIGGRAAALNSSYEKSFFVAGLNRVEDDRTLTFTHEIGHLFGCHHNFGQSWFGIGAFYNGHGYKNDDERWRTVMSYPYTRKREVGVDIHGIPIILREQDCQCSRIKFHSNPYLTASDVLVLDDEHSNNIPIGSTSPLGTKNYSFCINKIAKEYPDHINHEQTVFDKPNTMIRTDGIDPVVDAGLILNMPSVIFHDVNVFYADLLAINDISFSNISRITSNYSRTIRAGNAVDINSNGDASFEFDAEVGSEVDIKIIDFADTPEECQPILDKNSDREESENIEFKEDINKLLISPNPAHNSFKIQYNLTEGATINLWIIDLSGKTVKIVEKDVKKKKGLQRQIINIQDIPSGTYYINMTINGKKISQPLIVTK